MKIKNVCAVTDKYTDKKTGKERNKYTKVGVAFYHDDGSMSIKLDKTFNPAGVEGACYLYLFDNNNEEDHVDVASSSVSKAVQLSDANNDIPF